MDSLSTVVIPINVPFHGAELYVVNYNGEPYTPMKPIVEGMGMDWASQFTKLKIRFVKGIAEITIPSSGGEQSMICLALRKLSAWLNTISPNKVNPKTRERVIQYQEECDDVLYDYWMKGQAVNPRRPVGRPRKGREGKITIEQQEAIKQLVLTRGKSVPQAQQAKATITLWSALKSHFGITYKEIREDQFTEALSLVSRIPLEGEYLPGNRDIIQGDGHSLLIHFDEHHQISFTEKVPADAVVATMEKVHWWAAKNGYMCLSQEELKNMTLGQLLALK